MPSQLTPQQPTNIGLNDALSRLGSASAQVPGLGDLVSVLIVGDISQSLSSEVVEARGIASSFQQAAGNFCGAQLLARTAGGLIIESLWFSTTDTGAGPQSIPFVTLLKGPNGVLPAGGSNVTDIGGVPVAAAWQTFATGVRPTAVGASVFTLPCPTIQTYPGVTGPNDRLWGSIPGRIYLGPGEALALYAEVGEYFETVVVWRELVDAQGTAP